VSLPRASRVLLVALLACLALGLFVPVPAARASCVGPSLAVGSPTPSQPPSDRPAVVSPGGHAVVQGTGFISNCPDTVTCTAGCAGGCTQETPLPWTHVDLVLVDATGDHPLGTSDATVDGDRWGDISWDVDLPASVRPPAQLEARVTADDGTRVTLTSVPVEVRQ